MDFRFNEEQEELRSMARAFLEESSGSAAVRAAMESDAGWDEALWRKMADELGWPSVHIPEEYGGLGLGYVELVALLEIMGEHLVCAPFFSSVCLAANALLCSASEAHKQKLLPDIAAGTLRAALAWSGPDGRVDAGGIETTLTASGDGLTLNGEYGFVLDGHTAELLVMAVRAPGSREEDGVALVVVHADTPGVERHALPTMDQTRRLSRVVLHDVRIGPDAVLAETGAGWPALEKALQLAAIAQAAEQLGGAQRCLDMSVEYAKERIQFGRPIGSFQAIKHKCADRMVDVECARSAVYYAACAVAEDSDEIPSCASLAKAWASDTYFRCASDAIQIHGGVGFTWEYDVHLHFKRARSSESFLGDPSHHRELVARQIGL